MKMLPLVFGSLLFAGFVSVSTTPDAQAQQSPRFVMGKNTWARDPDTGLARRSNYNQLAPLAIQNVPSGKTVSVQSMTGVDFAKLSKRTKNTAVVSGRPLPLNPVVINPSVFGKPNVPAAATANSLRPGLPMTASQALASVPTRSPAKLPLRSVSNSKIGRNVSTKRIAKLPATQSYAQGVGFVPGSTAAVTYGTNKNATTTVGGKLLPKH